MSQINRIPRGLTGLLDIRAQGQTPREVIDTLQPTVDLLSFYALEKGLKNSGNVGGIAALGASISVTVPSSEAWLVYAASAVYTYGNTSQQAMLSLRLRGIGTRGGGVSDTAVASSDERVVGRSAVGAGQTLIQWTPGIPTIVPGGSTITGVLDDQFGAFLMNTLRVEVIYAQVGSFPGSAPLSA